LLNNVSLSWMDSNNPEFSQPILDRLTKPWTNPTYSNWTANGPWLATIGLLWRPYSLLLPGVLLDKERVKNTFTHVWGGPKAWIKAPTIGVTPWGWDQGSWILSFYKKSCGVALPLLVKFFYILLATVERIKAKNPTARMSIAFPSMLPMVIFTWPKFTLSSKERKETKEKTYLFILKVII
jgi:hypothetical protein